MPAAPVLSRWSTERAPSSIASGIAPDSVNWSPCRRSCQARLGAGAEIPPGLVDVESAALEEDVGRLGDPSGFRKYLRDEKVDVRPGAGVGELRRNRMGTEPRGNSSGRADRAQLGQLRVAIEPVSRFRLERRRAGAEHPADVALERFGKTGLTGLSRRANRGEDAPTRRMQLLVARSRRAQRELPDSIAREAGMGMAVDEARDRREPPPVELLDFALERLQVPASRPPLRCGLARRAGRRLRGRPPHRDRHPRRGAACPRGVATCARSRISSRAGAAAPERLTDAFPAPRSTEGRSLPDARRRAPLRTPRRRAASRPFRGRWSAPARASRRRRSVPSATTTIPA